MKTVLKTHFFLKYIKFSDEEDRRYEKGSMEVYWSLQLEHGRRTIAIIAIAVKLFHFAFLSKGSFCSFTCMITTVNSHQMENVWKCFLGLYQSNFLNAPSLLICHLYEKNIYKVHASFDA